MVSGVRVRTRAVVRVASPAGFVATALTVYVVRTASRPLDVQPAWSSVKAPSTRRPLESVTVTDESTPPSALTRTGRSGRAVRDPSSGVTRTVAGAAGCVVAVVVAAALGAAEAGAEPLWQELTLSAATRAATARPTAARCRPR